MIRVSDKVHLLKTTALYGANASGKSNFISAMYFFERYILSQLITRKGEPEFEQDRNFRFGLEPFALSREKNEASEFEIIFIRNGKQIQYGFECSETEVLNEWYYINDKKVYERKGLTVTYGSRYADMLSAYQKIPKGRLYLAVLEYFLDDQTGEMLLGDFISFFEEEYNVYSEIFFESTVKGVAGMVGFSPKLFSSKTFRSKVEHYLQLIDVGIKRLDVQTETIVNEQTGKKKKTKVVRAVHDIFDDEGNVIGEQPFDLSQESAGTLRFFAFIQNIIDMMSKGGVFIVDELSARLHPLLTKMIVDIFCSSQNRKAQLVFTTHDVSLLNNNQFRRDEVAFIDKNRRGESRLYALSDLKVREDATFSKDYLQGKYGAIPILDYDLIDGGEQNG